MKTNRSSADEQVFDLTQDLQFYMQTGLNYTLERMQEPSNSSPESKGKATVHSMRHLTGKALPFDFNEKTAQIQSNNKHWLSTTEHMMYLLHLCTSFGADGLSEPWILTTPEARHAFFKKTSRECGAIVESLGWNLEEERQFLILSGLEVPTNAREMFLLNLRDLLFSAPAARISRQGIEDLYGQLTQGMEMPAAENLDGSAEKEERRVHLLEALCSFLLQDETFIHPVLKALTAYLFITLLKPFSVANLSMGRLMYSWVLFESGLSLLSALPLVEFEESWQKGQVPQNGYQPRIDYLHAIVSRSCAQEWTCFYEELLGFLVFELRGFRNKLISLEMRRSRLQTIMQEDDSLNARQIEVLTEAVVHEDAEFSYALLMEQHAVGYATAYEDLSDLKNRGMLLEAKKGKQAYFYADKEMRKQLHAYLRSTVPHAYAEYYDEQGELQAEHAALRQEAMQHKEPLSRKRSLVSYNYPSFEPSRRFVLKDSFLY